MKRSLLSLLALFLSLNTSHSFAAEPEVTSANQQLVGTVILTAVKSGLLLIPGASAQVDLVELNKKISGATAESEAAAITIEVVASDSETTTFLVEGKRVSVLTKILLLVQKPIPSLQGLQLARPDLREGVAYKSALGKSMIFNVIVNTKRFISEPDTRHETLHGKYAQRYFQSILNQLKVVRYTDETMTARKINWTDSDTFKVNYLKHGIEGAIFAQFWCDADPKCTTTEFGFTRKYLKYGMLRPMLGSFISSLLFEMGPIFSEAGIGHPAIVKGGPAALPGKYRAYGQQDLWLTPAVGTIVIKTVADIYDKLAVERVDRSEVARLQTYRDYVNRAARESLLTGSVDPGALERESRRATSHRALAIMVRAVNIPKVFSHGLSGNLDPLRNRYTLPGSR